jgi:hypothetical protein
MALTETKEILLLSDDELEELIEKWIAQERTQYVDFERNSGSGDRGIDAVGFLTKQRYEADWHNYQYKQLNRSLGEPVFYAELGEVICYSCQGRSVACEAETPACGVGLNAIH